MGILTDAPSGQTDFMGYTHEQLLAMFGTASPTHAFEAALKLGTAFTMLNDATKILSTGVRDLNWSGESADNFRTWSDQLITSTNQLADYSLHIGQTLLDVAQSIGSAKLPPIPTADIELVSAITSNPEVVSVVATFNPAEASNLSADFTRAKDNIENLRIEAAAEMRKLAMGYEAAGRRMAAAVPPKFPPPPNIFEVSLVDNTAVTIPVDRGAADPGDTDRPKGQAPDKQGTTGPTGDAGAVPGPLPVDTTSIPAVSGPPVPGTEPGAGPPPTTDVNLVGTGTLTRPDTGPTVAPPPPVSGGGTGGTGGTGTSSSLPPPITGVPGSVKPVPGGAKPATGRPGVPGIAGGTASGTGKFGGPSGGTGATPPGRPYSTGPSGTFGGRPIPGATTPGTAGGSTGARPYGRPGASGIVGGQTVAGSGNAAPRGTTARATTPGVAGNRPFSPGGSGIRTDGGRAPGTTGRPGRPMVGGVGSAASPEERRRRRERADYLEEDDETWTTRRPPVPPVVD